MLKPNHDMTGKRGNSGDGGMICRVPMTGPSMEDVEVKCN